ncbi:cobalamin biosynthesis protein CobE [Pleomorphomonas diazotrophica]|uniref:Cobalamin biosynthesis protein CobE n=1 Tax=Pleomorphomonas diazotrophica TaxID=1166257 RepID=A0A2N3LW01_9HYPH|nr:cobalamin biosynthesis protein [Pleomorphomonas diazotrophica]PKR88674.1 cobalamin biosynthesis protein CobE [Pleomorphomonas diazotrophica]
MSGRLAIGVGCRRGVPAEAIIRLVSAATAGLASAIGLFTIEDKRGEAGLREAAESLALPLVFLSHDALAAMADRIATPSSAALARFGTPSVAEAAALAAFAGHARLIGPRRAEEGVTVAVAEEIVE